MPLVALCLVVGGCLPAKEGFTLGLVGFRNLASLNLVILLYTKNLCLYIDNMHKVFVVIFVYIAHLFFVYAWAIIMVKVEKEGCL